MYYRTYYFSNDTIIHNSCSILCAYVRNTYATSFFCTLLFTKLISRYLYSWPLVASKRYLVIQALTYKLNIKITIRSDNFTDHYIHNTFRTEHSDRRTTET